MKYLLAALCGMALTLGMFIGGAAFAIKYLSADPVPVETPTVASATSMPSDPVRVVEETDHRNTGLVENQPAPDPLPRDEALEPATGIEGVEPALEFDPSEPMPEIDEFTTASIPDRQSPEPATIPGSGNGLSDEHVSWCSERYRSYRPENNSYTPYSGGSRECVSPFSEEAADAPDEDASYLEASAGGGDRQGASTGYLSPEHIESCFSRYRSYRPEDNSYQPYGGGPRKQCQ